MIISGFGHANVCAWRRGVKPAMFRRKPASCGMGRKQIRQPLRAIGTLGAIAMYYSHCWSYDQQPRKPLIEADLWVLREEEK